MAERRMFAKTIINSARFLKMPSETQSLYFHLGLNADDDGIVEAFSICRSIGASEDNLKLLVAKGFVNVLNDDLVTHIMDWNEHNKIRPDRKIDSIYKDLLLQVIPDVELIEKRQRTDIKKQDGLTMDGQWTDKCPHRIGKDRIGEDSIGKDNIKEDKLLSQFKKQNEFSEDVYTYVSDFIAYRKQIKKPLKTMLPLNSYIKELTILSQVYFLKWEDCIEIMKSNEWQTLKADWILKTSKGNITQSKSQSRDIYIDDFFKRRQQNENIINGEVS